jgi:hypothetical protein
MVEVERPVLGMGVPQILSGTCRRRKAGEKEEKNEKRLNANHHAFPLSLTWIECLQLRKL